MKLKPETLAAIEEVIPRYPEKRGAMMPVLHLVQADQGCIAPEAMEWVADKLGLQPVQVYEVVTFYPAYRQTPRGRCLVRVCQTLPCMLAGAYRVCEMLQETLQCQVGSTSEDGEVTLEWAECLACCDRGPAVMVDDELFEKVDAAKVKEIAAKVRPAKY